MKMLLLKKIYKLINFLFKLLKRIQSFTIISYQMNSKMLNLSELNKYINDNRRRSMGDHQ
jgi:hypothetical protein